jgi:hypothetical protein
MQLAKLFEKEEIEEALDLFYTIHQVGSTQRSGAL